MKEKNERLAHWEEALEESDRTSSKHPESHSINTADYFLYSGSVGGEPNSSPAALHSGLILRRRKSDHISHSTPVSTFFNNTQAIP